MIFFLLFFLLYGQSSLTMHNHELMIHPAYHESMHGMYGRYSMMREASGTSWVPDSSPEEGFHIITDHWLAMFRGYSYLVDDVQRGKRGGKKVIDENMFMFMAQKDWQQHTFALRTMFSLEPVTIGACGYPLLLQTGETCNGKTPLIDRQHPHDLFMELALVYSYAFNKDCSTFLYFGIPGEPALGPPVYIMRFSSEYIPETPIGHHWMDSTHIQFGVATIGLVYNNFKLDCSIFTGREPDQHRFDIERPRFDSYALRLSYNPTENWALQTSVGFLKSPEQLEPRVNTVRYATSILYNKNWMHSNLQAAAIVGINQDKPGHALPAFLCEATGELWQRHLFFGRFEAVKKDNLFIKPCPLAHEAFNVSKLTLGYVFEFFAQKHIKWGLGGLIDFPHVPQTIKRFYSNTVSYMIFLQVRLIES